MKSVITGTGMQTLVDTTLQRRNDLPLQVLEQASLSATHEDRARDSGRVKKLFAVAFLLAMIATTGLRASSAGASVENTTAGQSQGSGKFNHTSQRHSQIKCDACHVRRADAIKPVMPGHRACIACHIREFTSKEFGICSNCHEGIKAVQPKVLTFPERQTFGTEFSHKTHATYVSGERRADCSSCHAVAGARTTFPAHRECYVCHKAPEQVKAGEKVGGASCGECHTTTGDKKPPSAMSKAYNYRFTHQVHAQREGIKCVECHNVLQSESAAQVSVPQLREHRGAGFQGCGSCHNGRRAFGGELVSNACIRCHGRNMM
jgi:c(7)-type cytochrome triheme protein